MIQQSNSLKETLTKQNRKFGALFGLYVADAVAMPVHWMYDLRNLKRDYGQIKGYVRPLDKFEGSIMNLSNTGGGGRGSDQGDIVGKVILHNKKKYWGRGLNYHYHLGLMAGENTLEAQLTRLVTRQITKDNDFIPDNFREAYMSFMQTPGSHNDTYAATAHRMFFKNLIEGVEPKLCPDNDGHNVDAIDALTYTVPIILKYSDQDSSIRNQKVIDAIKVVRKIKTVEKYAILFSDLLVSVLNGTDLQEATQNCAQQIGIKDLNKMVQYSQGDPMVACYIESSFPALLFIVYKYAHSAEQAILANANAGGENVARGSLLGSLIGAYHGIQGLPTWSLDGLYKKDEINQEIQKFLSLNENK